MHKKSALLIILMVFLSHNHSTLEGSIIPQWTFARIFTLCNSIFTPIKTRLARIGGIFSTIWHRKQSNITMEPIEHELTTFSAPEQSEYEYLQQRLKEEEKQVLSIIDEHAEKVQRTLTTSTLLGYGSLAAFHGLSKTPVPQLMAHYTRFKLASLLPVLYYAYPFALPAATLLIGGITAWRARCTIRNHRKDSQANLDKVIISFDEKLKTVKESCRTSHSHPNCKNLIDALHVKLNMKFRELSQTLEELSSQTLSILSNLEEQTLNPESEYNLVNAMKCEIGELCNVMSSAKEKQEEVNQDILGYFPQLKRLQQHPEGESSGD